MGRKIPFVKLEGAGNDFIIIEANSLKDAFSVSSPSLQKRAISRLCDRHFGIGADGLLIVHSPEKGVVAMEYYNADGSSAAFCGNGARCVVRYAINNQWIGSKGILESDIGAIPVKALDDDRISIRMPDAALPLEDELTGGMTINTGVPHLVVEKLLENPENFAHIASGLRWNVLSEQGGVNVNFYHREDENIALHTYEKGVEDETLACGTGAVATAIIATHLNDAKQQVVRLHALGGDLEVSYSKKDDGTGFTDIWLTGNANIVFTGEYLLANK